jgi:hypothetical protein
MLPSDPACIAAEVVDDYGGAPTGQLEGVKAAEAAARAGDDRDLAFEVDHVVLLTH